jgi:hypothetical protein
MRDWMKSLVEEVAAWPDISCHDHRFGGVEFRVGEREIGHVHDFRIVDIPFTVKIRDALIGAGKAEQHHRLPDSGWTTVRIGEHGAGNARELLRLSYLRILLKSSDRLIAKGARVELEASGLEQSVMEAAGVATVAISDLQKA